MSVVPRHRTSQYGSVENFTAWSSDPSGTKLSVAKAPAMRNLGYNTDSLLLSYGHKAPYARNIWNGGDFFKKSYQELASPGSGTFHVEYYRALKQWWYNEGLYFATNVSKGAPFYDSYSAIRSVMVPLGAKGWNRFRPGKPVASVSQFIGELRELPKNPFRLAATTVRSMRSYAGNRARQIDEMRRAVGEQYLNYSFGWRPFLADLEKIADFDENLKGAMQQLRRDNGRTIRRGGTIESDVSTTSSTATSGSPSGYMEAPYTSWSAGGSKREVTTTTSWRCWFSAGFVYHLPREDDPNSMDRLRTYLKGGGISPSVVWELTPWSWLADYFTNIGDVLENWEASRELALAAKYCYVMYQKTTSVVSAHSMWNSHPTYGSLSNSASFRCTAELKARTWASPYGFGFTSGNLNNSQKANLLALGLSRRI